MSSSRHRNRASDRFLPVVLAPALFALAAWSATQAQRTRDTYKHPPPVVVPSKALSLSLALGHETFAADVVWLRTLEYFGDSRYRALGFSALGGLLSLITDLDPAFCIVYQKAGLMLTTNEIQAVGLARHLLAKGTDNCAEDWYIPFLQGFNLFFFQREYAEGAHYLRVAAERPGSPEWLPDLALRVAATDGDLDVLERMLLDMMAGEPDSALRRSLEWRLAYVRTERVLRQVDAGQLSATAARDALGGRVRVENGRAQSESFPRRLGLRDSDVFREQWREGRAP